MKDRSEVFHKYRGFTLVELMVVVLIIGILAAIAFPRYARQADKAKTGRAVVEVSTFQNVLDLSFVENNRYPRPSELAAEMDDNGVKWAGKQDPWGNPYYYVVDNPDSPTTYTLICFGPGGTVSQDDDIVVRKGDDGPGTGQQASIPNDESLYVMSSDE